MYEYIMETYMQRKRKNHKSTVYIVLDLKIANPYKEIKFTFLAEHVSAKHSQDLQI
jgi:hypothetical protein